MHIDPWILAFSAVTVIATIWMGFRSARSSKTASDFFVAGRSVSVGWNASAISGEYLSAASFMGVAGMVMSSGYDALWYPVCYACGYLFLLLFIAGPLRRFGAYTIPDFAEGRFDSPVFRKIAVVFVLFIGFFYTMPQMKGAGTTLAYIFPGLPYWVGVVLVGAVITLNVALGGMKGITLVQAFQYWAKMFAISVPIFVLMAVYGHYGKQVGVNGNQSVPGLKPGIEYRAAYTPQTNQAPVASWKQRVVAVLPDRYVRRMSQTEANRWGLGQTTGTMLSVPTLQLHGLLDLYGSATGKKILIAGVSQKEAVERRLAYTTNHVFGSTMLGIVREVLRTNGVVLVSEDAREVRFAATNVLMRPGSNAPLSTNTIVAALSDGAEPSWLTNTIQAPPLSLTPAPSSNRSSATAWFVTPRGAAELVMNPDFIPTSDLHSIAESRSRLLFVKLGGENVKVPAAAAKLVFDRQLSRLDSAGQKSNLQRQPLPDKAPKDDAWLNPFGPLTTKAAKAAATAFPTNRLEQLVFLQSTNDDNTRFDFKVLGKSNLLKALDHYQEFVNRRLVVDGPGLKRINYAPPAIVDFGSEVLPMAEARQRFEAAFSTNGMTLVPVGEKQFFSIKTADLDKYRESAHLMSRSEWLAKYERPYSLLYTYSLIIALVCGTAGLPHILVRFYTNPDGVAAKRTTMWVMILIGVFYVFPPVFGVMGRNLLPELYSGVGAKGTDKVVLELPRILNSHSLALPLTGSPSSAVSGSAGEPVSGKNRFPWGSILSGITCAGAFAAFMSTFSGLLVSMTGAMAHDIYGRMLNPKATPLQRLRAFRIGAVLIGGVAILLGMQVEPLQINFMVGQAFAIAAASYFPLLFVSVWWRGLTMKGAATGMLTGGTLALAGISLTSFTDLKWLPLDAFWAAHPLLRILCEQPALWAVPLAIALMVIVSKFTKKEIPADIRMKMLVLHAPEKLGLKQEYIQEQHSAH